MPNKSSQLRTATKPLRTSPFQFNYARKEQAFKHLSARQRYKLKNGCSKSQAKVSRMSRSFCKTWTNLNPKISKLQSLQTAILETSKESRKCKVAGTAISFVWTKELLSLSPYRHYFKNRPIRTAKFWKVAKDRMSLLLGFLPSCQMTVKLSTPLDVETYYYFSSINSLST